MMSTLQTPGAPAHPAPHSLRAVTPPGPGHHFSSLQSFPPVPSKNEPVLLTAGEVMPHVDPGGRRAWACSSWPSCSREEAQQLGGGQWPQEPLLAGCPPDLTAAWVKGRINFLFSLPDAGSIWPDLKKPQAEEFYAASLIEPILTIFSSINTILSVNCSLQTNWFPSGQLELHSLL